MDAYFPILILLVIAIVLAVGMVILASLITRFMVRPDKSSAKSSTYESGVNLIHEARIRFSIKFYIVAMIFIIFDIEVVFFYPWAVVFREMVATNPIIFWEMIAFVGMLLLGYAYVWRKGGLDWD
ncbi:MAG: NADH-quinone oxidoreductase subunit A [Candidatus Poribacteria bacterium]|nr:NADH-quinone oxidoreductase subunit A [Candidatus Poribacteria bacterium]